jgi:hypothetical protein
MICRRLTEWFNAIFTTYLADATDTAFISVKVFKGSRFPFKAPSALLMLWRCFSYSVRGWQVSAHLTEIMIAITCVFVFVKIT